MSQKKIEYNTFLSKVSGAALIKIGIVVLNFLMTIYISRKIQAEGMGIISILSALTTAAVIFTLVGVDQAIIKNSSFSKDTNHIDCPFPIIFLFKVVLLISLAIIIITSAFADHLSALLLGDSSKVI